MIEDTDLAPVNIKLINYMTNFHIEILFDIHVHTQNETN